MTVSLWSRVVERSARALERGALESIGTEHAIVEDGGVPFVVRMLSSLRRKDEDRKLREAQAADRAEDYNPFLPWDDDLFVAELSSTHVCLLNKFNVMDHHLLIVTRAFEEQESPHAA